MHAHSLLIVIVALVCLYNVQTVAADGCGRRSDGTPILSCKICDSNDVNYKVNVSDTQLHEREWNSRI